MNAALLDDLHVAIAAGDAPRVREIAVRALVAFSPTGLLSDIAERVEASGRLDALIADFDADEAAVAYLDQESLLDRLEDGFALVVPTLVAVAGPLESWAIPLLAALAGPGAPLLNFGLLVACKIALTALSRWAEKRAAHIPTGGKL